MREILIAMSFWDTETISHVQDLEPLIRGLAANLSKRSRDAFLLVYDGDVAEFAYKLLDPGFSFKSIPKLGNKSIAELDEFSDRVLAMVEDHKSCSGLEDWEYRKRRRALADSGIPLSEVDAVVGIESRLGYLPVARIADSWIKGQELRQRELYRKNFGIWTGREVVCVADMACELGLTGERTRQLRIVAYDKLLSFVTGLEVGGPCPYDCFCPNLENLVNQKEGTSFNANFIRFLFGTVYPDLRAVGNVQDCILPKLRGCEADSFVAAVSENLCKRFSFDCFLSEIGRINAEKRTEKSILALPEDAAVRKAASAIAYQRYGWQSEDVSLIIPANADKNLPEIMEDILRDVGHTLSLDEIVQEFSSRCPDRTAEPSRIRANIHSNPNIRPIGRSGVYALAEWSEGECRGGTIRLFARECLDRNPDMPVSVSDVLEHVRKFRPDTTETNMVSNLMLETEKSFAVVWRDEVNYLMYSDRPVPEGFKRISRTVVPRRSFGESMALVNSFVDHNGRYPRTNGDEDEQRLARFLNTQRSLSRRGLLETDEQEALDAMDRKLAGGTFQLNLF